MKRFGWASVLILSIVMTACGDDTPPTQTGQPSPTEAPSESQRAAPSTTAAPAVASPYSSEPTRATTSEGWTYRFEPSWGAGVQLTFAKDTQTSPPGKARFTAKGAIPPGFSGRLVGDDPGRTAPNLEAHVRVFYPIANYDRSFDNTGSQAGITSGSGLGCDRKSYKIPTETSGMVCGMLKSKSVNGTVETTAKEFNTGSQSDDEARIDAFLKALDGVKPVYAVSIGLACVAYYLPDGRRIVNATAACK